MKKIIQPNYIKNFRCEGKICGVRCCRDWQIKLDGETYEKFLTLGENEREEIFNFIDENFSVIKMSAQGFCKFLDDDFLCKIQKKHGEDFLPAICQSFPRVTYKLDEKIFQQSMTLTCPIAAQIILLPSEPITFEEVQELKARLIVDFTKKLSHPTENFLQIQTQAIKILQDRNFSINERLKNLCAFFYENNLPPFEFNSEEHAATLAEIFNEMYSASLDEHKKNILRRDYLNNHENILRQVYENFSHILENYLVNEFFMRCYPCAFDGDDWLNCKIFVASFRLVEFSIILTTLAKKTLTLENLLELICSVNDKLDHSKGGMDAIKNFSAQIDDEKFFKILLA